MNTYHTLRGMICLCILGFFFSTFTYANTDTTDLDTLVKGKDFPAAIEQLDDLFDSLDSSRDVELWTITLLRGARVRALNSEHEAALDYLQAYAWPKDPLARIILKLGTTSEIEHYLNQKSWNLVPRSGRNEMLAKRHLHEFHQLITKLNDYYRSAFETAKKNEISLTQAKKYLTESEYPSRVRGYLADLITNRWMEFLVDDLYWSVDQQKQLNHISLSSLLGLDRADHLSAGRQHPLQRVKSISAELFEWHRKAGRNEAALEVARYYTKLVGQHFSSTDDIEALTQYLSKHVKQLGLQFPWWSMGQYQLALFRQQMTHQSALLEAHDLAVQASIAHPESVGAKRSKRLLDELRYQEFSVTGQRSSGLGQASLKVNYRNLYRLYFRAWRVKEPLPAHLDDAKKRAVVDILLEQPAELEWVAELADYSDLHHHEVQLVPEISEHGQWILMASPQAEFSDVPNKLQLLNLHLSHYVASVSYHAGEFRVAVYDGERGRSLPNITAELLQVNAGSSEVLEVARTDVYGIAVLPRSKDAEHYQVRLRHGVDSSVIDIPGLLPLRDERRWAVEPAKAVILTNKKDYKSDETVKWSLIAKAANARGKKALKALSETEGWMKLYDPEGQLVAEQRIKTGKAGLVSGEFKFSDNVAGVWRLESSWQGSQQINVRSDASPEIIINKLPEELFAGQVLPISGALSKEGSDQEPSFLSWQLRRTSYLPNGDLQSSIEVSRGSSEVIDQRFGFEVSLSVADESKYLRNRFELQLDYRKNGQVLQTLIQTLRLTTDQEYFSIVSDKAFHEVGEGVHLTLSRTNSRWQGVSADSQWFLYKLNAPNKSAKLPREEWGPWLLGGLEQEGVVKHDADGNAALHVRGLEAGTYRIRLMNVDNAGALDKSVAELDFIVAQYGHGNYFGMSGVLLAQKAEVRMGETLKLLAGSELDGQWVRLNVLKHGKAVSSQMLSPGVHLLEFPITELHQGGLGFNLEWVERNQLHNKDILVTVPWYSKQLQLKVVQDESTVGKATWKLQASKSKGAPLINSKAEALIYYSEVKEKRVDRGDWADLGGMYQQSGSSMIRLDNNGVSYPYYFRGSRRIAPPVIKALKHPDIRYSDKDNDDYLGKDSDFDVLPMMVVNTENVLGGVQLSAAYANQKQSSRHNHQAFKGITLGAQYLRKGVLDANGSLVLEIPEVFKGKKVRADILLVSPDMETGQLSVDLW